MLEADPPRGHEVYADSAYRSREKVSLLRQRGYKPRTGYNGKRGHPLSSRQVALNHGYSRVRCRVWIGLMGRIVSEWSRRGGGEVCVMEP